MEQEKDILQNSDIGSSELGDALKFMGSVFEELKQDAQLSSLLLERNIHDSLAEYVKDTLKNPINAGYSILRVLENNFSEVIHQYVIRYFRRKSNIIDKVYKAKYTGPFLHYSIILKDNNIKTRSELREFLVEYNNKSYSSRFPVIFQDIPKELVSDFMEELKNENFELVEYEATS